MPETVGKLDQILMIMSSLKPQCCLAEYCGQTTFTKPFAMFSKPHSLTCPLLHHKFAQHSNLRCCRKIEIGGGRKLSFIYLLLSSSCHERTDG